MRSRTGRSQEPDNKRTLECCLPNRNPGADDPGRRDPSRSVRMRNGPYDRPHDRRDLIYTIRPGLDGVSNVVVHPLFLTDCALSLKTKCVRIAVVDGRLLPGSLTNLLAGMQFFSSLLIFQHLAWCVARPEVEQSPDPNQLDGSAAYWRLPSWNIWK
jgi:hypothetical protein